MTLVSESKTLDDVPEGKRVLAVLDSTGDTRIIWDPEIDDEVESARRTFDDLKKKGYTAYTVKRGGGRGDIIQAFDPDIEKLILAPATVGG